jgi:hypothetical protein
MCFLLLATFSFIHLIFTFVLHRLLQRFLCFLCCTFPLPPLEFRYQSTRIIVIGNIKFQLINIDQHRIWIKFVQFNQQDCVVWKEVLHLVRSKPMMFEYTLVLFTPFKKPEHKITQFEGFGTNVVLKPQGSFLLLLLCVFIFI